MVPFIAEWTRHWYQLGLLTTGLNFFLGNLNLKEGGGGNHFVVFRITVNFSQKPQLHDKICLQSITDKIAVCATSQMRDPLRIRGGKAFWCVIARAF